ncbi:MAG: Na+/H+ antiporter subunit C [Thermodesulfobacteriota bacterium]
MSLALVFLIGLLYAAGTYMMLRRSMVKLIIGFILLGHAANLLIFTASRLTREKIPIIDPEIGELIEPFADPVPQALVLTAIVIGFGIQAFVIVLYKRTYSKMGTEDLDELTSTDSLD